ISINEEAELQLGSGYINSNVNIACYNKIIIGHNVAISENVVIRDSDNHKIIGSNRKISQPIIIEDNVWIGMNVIILKGVRIGSGSVIAAGSVVVKDVPSNCLVAGSPAVIKKQEIEWEI